MGFLSQDRVVTSSLLLSFTQADGALPGTFTMLDGDGGLTQTPRDVAVSGNTCREPAGAVVAPRCAYNAYVLPVILGVTPFRISGYATGIGGEAFIGVYQFTGIAPTILGVVGDNSITPARRLFWNGVFVTVVGGSSVNRRFGLEVLEDGIVRGYQVIGTVGGYSVDNANLDLFATTPFTAAGDSRPIHPGLELSGTSAVDEILVEVLGAGSCVGQGINPVWTMPTV